MRHGRTLSAEQGLLPKFLSLLSSEVHPIC